MRKNSINVIQQKNKGYLLLFCLALFFITLSSCKMHVQRKDSFGELKIDTLQVELECYINRMPMADMTKTEPYVVITATPLDSVIHNNLKIVELTAIGDSGTWTAQTYYDNDIDYKGKGLKEYRNIALSFDSTIGSTYDFKLVIQFESGTRKTYEFDDVPLINVY